MGPTAGKLVKVEIFFLGTFLSYFVLKKIAILIEWSYHEYTRACRVFLKQRTPPPLPQEFTLLNPRVCYYEMAPNRVT